MLRKEKRASWSWNWRIPQLHVWVPRVAFAFIVALIGFSAGYRLKPAGGAQVNQLTQEVSDLKEMVMLSLLEKESASERLRAVSLTEGMSSASTQVTSALFKTLNEDSNVNVRLAALEALKPYVEDDTVRQQLIASIAHQRSPLVQLALADLMVAIQEKKSVDALRKVLDNENTPSEVKTVIRQSIHVLI
jgi:hypothetical protein